MKAILEFELPDEKEEFEMARRAGALSNTLHKFANWLRTQRKYSEDTTIDYEDLHDIFYSYVTECNVGDLI